MTQRLKEYRRGNEEKGACSSAAPTSRELYRVGVLFEHGANIIESNQYTTDPEGGRFS